MSKPSDKTCMYAHLEVLAEDMASFGYEAVRAFHGIWLQEVEQGRVTWADSSIRDTLRRRFVWNPAIARSRPSRLHTAAPSPTPLCSFCLTNFGRKLNHTEAECMKKEDF